MNKEYLSNFYCRNCRHRWKGMYIPLYCPACEKVLGIAILTDRDEEKQRDHREN